MATQVAASGDKLVVSKWAARYRGVKLPAFISWVSPSIGIANR